MKPKVNVLLATYNGEKYLRRQLDSVLAQTYDNIDIYIRDDGSSDKTVDIIKEYADKEYQGKRVIYIESDGKNLRCPGSFYEIARCCDDADYYAFCDQDDEWYPEKIEWAVTRLEKENNDGLLVYYTASDYLEDDGTFIRKSPLQKEKLTVTDVMYYTPGSGFTIVFNDVARRKLILDCNPGNELHDRWMLRGAACFGKAIYDQNSSAAHIRHAEAVTADDSDNRSLLANFVKNELMGKGAKEEKRNLRYFTKTFWEDLDKDEKKQLELFCRKKNTPALWLKKVFYPRRLRQRFGGELALRILFFCGIL